MKKQGLIIAALALLATSAFATASMAQQQPPAGGPPPVDGMHHEWTLEEARKHAHEQADRFDKMTPQEWAEHEKRRREFFDKWDKMTPEQKEADRAKRQEYRKNKAGSGASSIPGGATPPAPPAGN